MSFQISVDVSAPPEIVWSVISDAEHWHEWTASVREIRLLDKGPLAIGTRALIRQPKFPPAVWKVTALEPGKSFVWRSGAPAMWVNAFHSVEPMSGGARATLRLDYEGPIGALLARVTRGITNRYLQLEAAGLKKRSEELFPGPR